MGSAMTIGLLMGGLSAASSIAGRQGQAAQYRAQAEAARGQAERAQAQGEVEAKEIERRKIQLRREYEENQGRNRSLLAAGNVDMATGSAAQVAEGNASRFASDLGENAYAKAMKEWETKANVASLNAQADNAEAMAKSQASLLPSVLNAAITGAGGFASGYSMAGGSLSNLFAGKGGAAQLAAKTGQPISKATLNVPGGQIWGHPSGKTAFLPFKR